MLKKLIKYDLKWLNKVLVIYYIAIIIIALLTRFIETFEPTNIITIIDKILIGIFVALVINIIINSILRLWIRFNINLYKDESYLTHTLPISKDKLFDAKIISGLISLITSIIVILISALIIYLNNDTINIIKELIENLKVMFGSSTALIIISLFLIIILEFMYLMNIGIIGLVIGNRSNNMKILKSIVIGAVIYGLSSGIMLLIIYIIGQFNPNIMEFFKEEVPSVAAMKQMLYLSLILYTIYNIIIYLLSKNIFKKGVNVE